MSLLAFLYVIFVLYFVTYCGVLLYFVVFCGESKKNCCFI